MSSKKRLFESEDFDKKKKLFTPEDFDKDASHKIPHEHQNEEAKQPSEGSSEEIYTLKPKNWFWYPVGALVVLVVIICLFVKLGNETPSIDEEAPYLTDQNDLTATDSTFAKQSNTNNITASEVETSPSVAEQTPAPTAPELLTTANREAISSNVASTNVSNDIEREAMKVIRGDYGVGQERKAKLGSKYQAIQSRVNELKRAGLF